MSEYQYYDFRAIDRVLTKDEVAALRGISTRAAITSTSFTNHYEWGSLNADPLKLLEKYFDAFLYVANGGPREFYIRLPREWAGLKALREMLPGEAAHVREAGSYPMVGFTSETERDEWDDGAGWMGSLISLRSDLLRGDLRCLYLGWLLCAQHGEFAEDDLEPSVPPGMGELSAPLDSLVEFLGIDESLVEAAALASAPLNAGPGRKQLEAWIQSLPEREKDDLLVTAVLERDERWRNDLLRRFERHNGFHAPAIQRRTAGDLLAAAQARADEKSRLLSAKKAAETARRKAEDEANRARYLDLLEKRAAAAWDRVAAHIQKRQPSEYDAAAALLTDLRDLAIRQGKVAAFQSALEELRRKHANKGSLLRRLEKISLTGEGKPSG